MVKKNEHYSKNNYRGKGKYDIDYFDKPKMTKSFQYIPDCVVLCFGISNILKFSQVGKGVTKTDLSRKVKELEEDINSILYNPYYWDERKENDFIIMSNGVGYTIGFNPSSFKSNISILEVIKTIHITLRKDAKVKMGITKLPNLINYYDITDKMSLFGYGIYIATRVMNMALDNQILIEANYAYELTQDNEFKSLLKDGEMLEKMDDISEPFHELNSKIGIYNYYKENEFGN